MVSASGEGKTSLVQAGLFPVLRQATPLEVIWEIARMRPGASPFRELAAALLDEEGVSAAPVPRDRIREIDRLATSLRTAGAPALEQVLTRRNQEKPGTRRYLLFVDQW